MSTRQRATNSNSDHPRASTATTRAPTSPTDWDLRVYTGADFLDRMLADRNGNIVVIAGNNARKTEYILRAVEAGFNVLADKPMVRTPADLVRLEQASGRQRTRACCSTTS